MAVRKDSLEHTLESVDTLEPSLHQMQILQQNPVTLVSSIKESIFSRFLLTLTHRNVSKLFVTKRDIVFRGNSFHLRRRVDSWEQHKEDRNTVVCFSKGLENVERRLLDVSLAHHLAHKGIQS